MKNILRIPTVEPYGYVESEFEGTADEAIGEQRRLTKLMTGGVGLDTKDFNRVLDKYIWGDGTMTSDEYAGMNLEQQTIIQCVKRSRARNKK